MIQTYHLWRHWVLRGWFKLMTMNNRIFDFWRVPFELVDLGTYLSIFIAAWEILYSVVYSESSSSSQPNEIQRDEGNFVGLHTKISILQSNNSYRVWNAILTFLNHLSSTHEHVNGVPQGSPLSGILFIIGINNIFSVIPPSYQPYPICWRLKHSHDHKQPTTCSQTPTKHH